MDVCGCVLKCVLMCVDVCKAAVVLFLLFLLWSVYVWFVDEAEMIKATETVASEQLNRWLAPLLSGTAHLRHSADQTLRFPAKTEK